MKNLIIFDADSIIWTIAYKFRNKKVARLMLISLNSFIREVIKNARATHYIGFYGSKEKDREPNFRYAIDPKYKAQRPPEPDWITKWRPVITQEMTDNWGFVSVEGIEADDAVAMAANHYKDDYDQITVATVDKDLRQIPNVTYYNYGKHETEEIDVLTAAKALGMQLLQGDTADNVKGLYNIGPRKAKSLVEPCEDVTSVKWTVMRMYAAHEEDLRKKITRAIVKSTKKDVDESDWSKGKTDKQVERQIRMLSVEMIDEEMESKMPGGWKAYYKQQHSLLALLTDQAEADNFVLPEPEESEVDSGEDAVVTAQNQDNFLYI